MSANRLTCEEAFRRLDDYLDRELGPGETAEVQGHLEVCARCAGEFGIEAEVLDAVREKLRRIAAPPDLMAAISAKLAGAREAEG